MEKTRFNQFREERRRERNRDKSYDTALIPPPLLRIFLAPLSPLLMDLMCNLHWFQLAALSMALPFNLLFSVTIEAQKVLKTGQEAFIASPWLFKLILKHDGGESSRRRNEFQRLAHEIFACMKRILKVLSPRWNFPCVRFSPTRKRGRKR